MTESTELPKKKLSWPMYFLMVLTLACGGWSVFKKFAESPEVADQKTERVRFTLHWQEDPTLQRFVSYSSDGSPLHPAFGYSSSFLRHEIDGQDFNGSAFYGRDSRKGKKADKSYCELYLRRDDEGTIVIKLSSEVPVQLLSDDDANSLLATADGKPVPWGANLEPGQYDLRATRVDP